MRLNKNFSKLLQLILVGIGFISSAALATEKQPITIGLLPGGDPVAVVQQSTLFAEKLQAKLGQPIQIFISKNYQGLIDAVKSEKVDFAFLSSLTYVLAEKQTPVKVLLKKTWDGPFYFSALIVRADSKLKKVKDLKGKKILFVDEKSTSGYLYPQVFLRKNKMKDADFESIRFSGNHAASVEALENKKADVIAVFGDDDKGQQGAWTRFAKKKSVKYRVLWISDPIPSDPFVVRQAFYDHDPKLTHEIMYQMIEIQNESAPKSLLHEVLGHGELMPATQKQYDPVREMAAAFEIKEKL